MKIFISFSSQDESILRSFVDHFLLLGLGISAKDIDCTGIEGAKPQTGEDFKNWIKDRIINSDYVIQLISENYKRSEVCLNEMGAAWALDKTVLPILIKPLDYSDVGFLHGSNQLLKIDSKGDLLKLTDELTSMLKLMEVNSEKLNGQIDIFHSELCKIKSEVLILKGDNVVSPIDYSYFDQFKTPNVDFRKVILQAQPTLLDCKLVFSKQFYNYCYHFYHYNYLLMLKYDVIDDFIGSNYFEFDSKSSNTLYQSNHSFPGGMSICSRYSAINRDIDLFKVIFKKNQSDAGQNLFMWAYLNNRWVYFGKSWKIVEAIADIIFNESFNESIEQIKNKYNINIKDRMELTLSLSKIIESELK